MLLLLDTRDYRAHWFETGTPALLIDLLKERQTWVPRLGQLESDADLLSRSEVGDIAIEPLITAFFESIPHQWFTSNPITQYEGYVEAASCRFPQHLRLSLKLKRCN